jgi:hypothetical protein
MLRHLTLAVALRAFGVRRVQRVNGGGLQLQLRHMGMDHHELSSIEQYPIRQAQGADITLL